MKDEFNNDKNDTGRINKPLQEITDKELAEKVQLYAGLAPNDKERFQVLRFHQNYISLKHSREKNQMARDHWFTQGQRIGLNQDKTLADERSNQDKLLGHARKITFKDIKELYHQNYSTTKSFNNEAQNKTDKDTILQKRKEIGRPIEVYHPNGELNDKNFSAFINNVKKLAPNEDLKLRINTWYQTRIEKEGEVAEINREVHHWVDKGIIHGVYPNGEAQKGLNLTNELKEKLRERTKASVKKFYHQNYSVSKSFNEVGKEKPKDKGLDMDKG